MRFPIQQRRFAAILATGLLLAVGFVAAPTRAADTSPLPAHVQATPSSGQIAVEWTDPPQPNTVTQFRAHTDDAGGHQCIAGPAANNCVITGVPNGSFSIRLTVSYLDGGEPASASLPLGDRVWVPLGQPMGNQPPIPTGVTAQAGPRSITVGWDDPGDPLLTHNVYALDPADVFRFQHQCGEITGTSCTIPNLTAGKPYEVHVHAVYANARSYSMTATATPDEQQQPPAPSVVLPEPTGVQATATASTEITVTFDAPGENRGRFIEAVDSVTRMQAGACIQIDPAATTCLLSGLAPGTSYDIIVMAFSTEPNTQEISPPVSLTVTTPGGAGGEEPGDDPEDPGDGNPGEGATVSMSVEPGQRTASVADALMGSVTYGFTAGDLEAILAATVADASGSDAGWRLTLQASPLEYSGSSQHASDIPADHLTVDTVGTPISLAGASAEGLTAGTLGNLGVARPVVRAAVGKGQGRYVVPLDATLTIPALSAAGTYTGSLTVSLVAGP